MIEVRNISPEPFVLKLSTYDATIEINPGASVTLDEYEPGMTLAFWPKYDSAQPRRARVGVRRDDAQAAPV